MRLVANKKKYLELVMKPNFKDDRKFSDNLMVVEMGKTKFKMVKSNYLVPAILDLRKLLIYESHYDYIVPKYGEKFQLFYMDRDSFVYHIEVNDF